MNLTELRRIHESDIRAFIVSKYGIDDATADRVINETFAKSPARSDRAYLFSLAANAALAPKRTPDDGTFAPAIVEPMRRQLAALRRQDRQAVALVCLGGLSYREAATACGVPVESLKTRLRRGLRTLAK